MSADQSTSEQSLASGVSIPVALNGAVVDVPSESMPTSGPAPAPAPAPTLMPELVSVAESQNHASSSQTVVDRPMELSITLASTTRGGGSTQAEVSRAVTSVSSSAIGSDLTELDSVNNRENSAITEGDVDDDVDGDDIDLDESKSRGGLGARTTSDADPSERDDDYAEGEADDQVSPVSGPGGAIGLGPGAGAGAGAGAGTGAGGMPLRVQSRPRTRLPFAKGRQRSPSRVYTVHPLAEEFENIDEVSGTIIENEDGSLFEESSFDRAAGRSSVGV